MSEFEPPAYDAGAFWKQVKRGIVELVLPDDVSDPKSEAAAWAAWHVYLAGRTQPTWHFDSERFGDAMRTHWPGLARVWIEESDRLIDGKMVYGESTIPYVPGVGLDWSANPDRTMSWGGLHYMFFLRWPIRAAMLTGEGKYVRAVADCVRSYLDQIDDIHDEAMVLKRGVKAGGIYAVWNTLSVGLKLKALGEALYALRAHPEWTVADCRAASILIWRLARHLHEQVASQTAVEWQQQLNFIASGSGGMGGVGALLPEWADAEGWLEAGRQIAYSDPDYRTWYYGTRGQNTVWIDEDDQDLWRQGGKRRIWGRLLNWRDEESETYVRISHEGYLRSKGVRHERTVLLKKGKYFLIYDLLDAAESDVTHTLRWTLRCPDELREVENRTVVSVGDPGIKLAPAWSDAIRDVEIGWGPSMVPLTYRADMSAQKAQVCHVRFVQKINAGAQARFLVLMISGECQDGAVQGEVADGRIGIAVTAWGEKEHIVLK